MASKPGRRSKIVGTTAPLVQPGATRFDDPRFRPGGGGFPSPTVDPIPAVPPTQLTILPGFGPQPPAGGGGGILDELGDIGIDLLRRRLFGGNGAGGAQPLTAACPEGFRFNPQTGQCESAGIRGTVERMLPGGRTGVLEGGQPTVNDFGVPAVTPMVVGQITRNNGQVSPILRCRRGLVLGKDNLCYMKGALPRGFRKWKPAPKPPISAKQAKALRSRASAERKIKELAGSAGLTCRRRGTGSRKK